MIHMYPHGLHLNLWGPVYICRVYEYYWSSHPSHTTLGLVTIILFMLFLKILLQEGNRANMFPTGICQI